MKINILSYNIHKGKSFFTRFNKIDSIKNFILPQNYDLIFLQEVRDFHCYDFKKGNSFQLERFISDDYKHENIIYGKNSKYVNGHHGNALISKHTILKSVNFDISLNKMEQRGLLYNKIKVGTHTIHSFCTHINLIEKDRLIQIEKIINIINQITNPHDKVILTGDFNDFKQSVTKRVLEEGFKTQEFIKTFPNILPVFAIDKIFVKNIELLNIKAIKHKQLILMSDHLPLLGELRI